MSKFVLLAVAMVLQVYLTMAEDPSESQGILERAKETYGELRTKVVDVGSTAYDFIQMYYEDQVKPVTDPYVEWAKEKASAVWETIKNRVSADDSK